MRTDLFFNIFSIYILSFLISLISLLNASSTNGEWRIVGGEPSRYKGFASLSKGVGDTLFAGGDSGVAVWTGKQWITIASTPVYRTAYHAPYFYAIGDFSEIAGCKSRNIARWDGHGWQTMDGGVHSSEGSHGIKAVAIAHDGSLYIGGTIDSAGGAPAHNFVRWFNGTWDTTGSGQLNGSVIALACGDDGSMYAATGLNIFSRAQQNWIPIPLNIGSVSDLPSEIDVMAVGLDGTLFVGGYFPKVGGELYYSGLIAWNGKNWSSFPSGHIERVTDITISASGRVYAVASNDFQNRNTSQNDIRIDYVLFGIRDSILDTCFATHIGVSTVNSPVPMIQSSIAVANDSVMFINFGRGVDVINNKANVELRSGLVENGVNGIRAITYNGHDLFACGQAITHNGKFLGNLIRWDRSVWNSVGYLNADIRNINSTPDGGLVASGYFGSIAGITATLDSLPPNPAPKALQWKDGAWSPIEKWQFPEVVAGRNGSYYRTNGSSGINGTNGTSICMFANNKWDTIGTGVIDTFRWGSGAYERKNPNPAILALACIPSGDLVAIGRFDYIRSKDTSVRCLNAALWNGNTWSSLNLPDSLSNNNKYNNTLQSIVIDKNGRIYTSSAAAYRLKSPDCMAQLLFWENGKWTLLATDSNSIVPFTNEYSYSPNRKYELLLDSSGSLYRNFTTNGKHNGISVYRDTSWTNYNYAEHPELDQTTNLALGPDNSIYCLNKDRDGFYHVMQYSPVGFPTAAPAKKKQAALCKGFKVLNFHKGQLCLNVPEIFHGMDISVTLRTLNGRTVQCFRRQVSGTIIPLQGLCISPGVYFITVENRNISFSSEIMVVR